MSSSFCLQVIRLENLRWRHPLHSNVPDLYVKVTFGNTIRRTATVKKNTSPVWDEPLVFSCDSVDHPATFNIQIKHHSMWSSNPRIGTIDISVADLLGRCAHGEATLDLIAPNNMEMGQTGRLVLKLRAITDVEAASISLEGVRRAKVMRLEGASDVIQSTGTSIARVHGQGDFYRAIGELLSRFDVIRRAIDELSEIHPFFTVAWKLVSGLYTVVVQVFDTDERVIGLINTMSDAFAFVNKTKVLPDTIADVQQPVVELLKQSIECCLFVRNYVGKGFLERMLDVRSSGKVDEFERSLTELKQKVESGMNFRANLVSMRSSQGVDELVLRQRLNPTLSSTFNRTVCLYGTRVEIRSQIIDWIFSETRPNVLWLHGVAGSGKSTISTTIVEHLRGMHRLGAFLFVEREKSGPETIITSIAFQLAMYDSSIASSILSETADDKMIATGSLEQQFNKLILRPLSDSAASISGPVIVVLDALDECGIPETRLGLIRLIQRDFPKLPCAFRFLVTSRREADIDKILSSQPENVLATELDYRSSTSQSDVLLYIRTEMDSAVRHVVDVPSEWPWDESMASLSRAAGGLFIWASTAVKTVRTSDNPFDQLEFLLSGLSGSHSLAGHGLNQLYSVVLRRSGITWGNRKSRDRFVKVLSLLLLSKAPLTTKDIDGLLSFPPHETSLLVLSRLRSVLTYTPGGHVSLFHASFADYLTSLEHRDDPWFIDTAIAKRHIVDRCFAVMEDLLRFNICGVKTSFSRNDADPGLADRIQTCIPSHLNYACLYWSQHFLDIDCSAVIVEQLSKFARHRLLFWFEVLSLKKQFGRIAIRALRDVASWIADEDLSLFLQDASKLASIFALPIMESVPHIYISMIPLSKDDSTVSTHYSNRLRSIVVIERKGVMPPSVCLKALTGHSGWVYSISVSPDGRRIASASEDGTVRVWDMDSGEEVLQPCIKHSTSVLSVSFFPDSRRIVSEAKDGTVTVWDAENGDVVLGPLRGHTKYIRTVTVSQDGSMIASGSYDFTIIIWNASDGGIVSHLNGHTGGVNSVSFSRDGTRLASGSDDETVRIWNVKTGTLAISPFACESSVNSVAFSPDSSCVASGSNDEVTIWDSTVGNIISVLKGHTNTVTSVTYSLCGTRIVSGSFDRTIIVWDPISGEIVSGPLKGHSDFVSSVTVSRDGKHIVSGSRDKTMRIWDATSITVSTTQERHTGRINSIACSSDASRIASASDDYSIMIWDTLTGRSTVGPLVGHSDRVECLSFTRDNMRLISGSWDGTIGSWNVETGHLLGLVEVHTGGFRCIAVSPDGALIVSSSEGGAIKVWDAATGVLIAGPLCSHSGCFRTVAYSRCGKRLALIWGSNSFYERVIIWDTDMWAVVSELAWEVSSLVRCACFSSDSSLLAFGMLDGTVLIRDVKSGLSVCDPLKGHTSFVASVVFLLDTLHVVSGSLDGTIRVWDRESGQTICMLEGHSQCVSSLTLSADGASLVSGSWDSTVRVWSVSDLVKPRDSELIASPSSWRGDVSDWVLGDDGWLRPRDNTEAVNASLGEVSGNDNNGNDGSNDNLLLWVPPDLRFTLLRPQNTVILNCEFSTKVNFTDAPIGERWSECLSPS